MTHLAFGVDTDRLLAQRLYGNSGKLADPDTGASDRPDDAGQPVVAFLVGLTYQTFVFFPGQLPGLVLEKLLLDPGQTDAAFFSPMYFR